jgi:hypothetical protein
MTAAARFRAASRANDYSDAALATHRTRYLLAGVLGLLVVAYSAAAVLLDNGTAVKAFFPTYVHSALRLAAAGIVIRTAVRSPRERAAWACIAVALTAYAAGEITWRFVYADDPAPPFPSWADGLWLLTYPAFHAGTILLSARADRLAGAERVARRAHRRGDHHRRRPGVLRPAGARRDGRRSGRRRRDDGLSGDLLLLALLVAVVAVAGGKLSRASLLLALGQAAIAVGDVFYALGTAKGTYFEGRWPDVLSPLGVLMCPRPCGDPRSSTAGARWRCRAR